MVRRVPSGVGNIKNGGTGLEISTQSEIAAAVPYLQWQDLADVGADTFIFTQGIDNGMNNDLDIIVRLEDVQIDGLVTAIGSCGVGDLFIA